MKLFKPNKPKKNIPLVLYLSAFNGQSMAVTQATRAWAAQRLASSKNPFR